MASRPLNLDEREIAWYEDQAAGWWDTGGEDEAASRHQPPAGRLHRFAGVSIRQAGVGRGVRGGLLYEAMAERGAEVTGIDMGEAPLAVARPSCAFPVLPSTTTERPPKKWPKPFRPVSTP